MYVCMCTYIYIKILHVTQFYNDSLWFIHLFKILIIKIPHIKNVLNM